ncbi:MAG: SDR family oxidoreductase [Pseudomonadota bacterium]
MDGKRAFISGAASGIGAATATQFVAEGAQVAVADIDEARGREVATSLGESAIYVRLDVTREEDWVTALTTAQTSMGPLTTIVNSAGVSVPASIEDLTFDAFKRTLSINLDGVFLGCKHGLAMIKDARSASIINICSTLGVRGAAMFAAYCTSKGGVRMLTKSVAAHCAERGYDVRVNCVLPGAIHTEMVEGFVDAGVAAGATREMVLEEFAAQYPMKRLGKPQEVAHAIVYLASAESGFTTGADLPVDGGYLI